jgi:hypothetical protein
MQHTGYVGGRDYDGVCLALIGRRVEKFMLNPIVVPFALDLLGRVLVCNVHSFYFVIFNRLFGLCYARARATPRHADAKYLAKVVNILLKTRASVRKLWIWAKNRH